MTRTIVMEGSFENLLERSRNGDVIELCQVAYNDWCAHLCGVNIMRIARNNRSKKFFRLNGKHPLTCAWDTCVPPRVELIGNNFWTFTESNMIVHAGKLKRWAPHPKGIMWISKDKILINSGRVIYRGKVDEVKFHPCGALARLGNRFFLVVSK